MRCVYVAGQITKGDQALNVRAAIDAATTLLHNGISPFVPHLTWFWHMVHPGDYEDWLTYDFEWIRRCDALLRIPGESAGADREVAFAESIGIPVFTEVSEILDAVATGVAS